MRHRPNGTVTFLFSDIEGSTERWERDREAMGTALARHDALLRTTLEARDGHIFKTIGDAFCCAFSTAPDAAAAALDAQRAIVSENFTGVDGLRVRMALHTGDPVERDGDYFGPTLNRIARLLAIGHGGQVLVSGAAAELIQGAMPPQSSLRDLGPHRLKDLERPEQVYQLIAPDLPESFPPLRSLDELPNNLPRQLTSFVGRDQVLADVRALIKRSMLVTLVGTGGAGKTRCAIQIGADLLDTFKDGVWLAELAPISDPELVPNALAKVMNAQVRSDRPVLDGLVAYLKRKKALLILDNCEHVLNAVRSIVAAILRQCPDLRILATSRASLNISGEEIYRVPSLAQTEAVQLFTDRARSVDNHFALTQENERYVTEICTRLDGIPLAIELAAARIRVLSPKQLAQKLDERFRLLTGGDRAALPRQQTMRALIDWSYDLLSDDERAIFRKLAIFAGGFTLEAAAAVCGSDALDEIAVLDLLTSLVDKSLVHAEPVADGTRYRLLESTREYAREKLNEHGEYPTTARAHAEAFLALAEHYERKYETTPDREWNAQTEREMENWRAALEWTLTLRGDVNLGQRMGGAMRWMWVKHNSSEGRRWVRTAMATIDAESRDSVIGRLHLADAHLNNLLVQYKATYDAAQRACEILERCGDPGAAAARRFMGRALVFLGRAAEGEAILRSVLTSTEGLGEKKSLAHTLHGLASVRHLAGDMTEARTLLARARVISREVDSQPFGFGLSLAEWEFAAGNTDVAVQLVRETLADANPKRTRTGIVANLFTNLTAYLVALERYGEARDSARDALALTTELQIPVLTAFAMQHLAAVAVFRPSENGQAAHEAKALAAHLFGYANAQLAALDARRERTEQSEYDKVAIALRATYGEAELTRLMEAGASWTEDQALAESMLI